MKKLVVIGGGLLAANVVANIGINTLRSSGGSLSVVAFLALPYLAPAPLNLMAQPADAV